MINIEVLIFVGFFLSFVSSCSPNKLSPKCTYEKQVEQLSDSINQSSNIGSLYYHRALLLRKQKQLNKAIVDLNSAITYSPNQPEPYQVRASVYEELGIHQKAMEDYTAAIEICKSTGMDSSDAFFYVARGNFYAKNKNTKAAIQDFDNAIILNQYYHPAYNNRGMAKSTINDHIGAIEDYTTSIKLFADQKEAYYNRASSKMHLNQVLSAIDDYNIAIQKDSLNGDFYFERGYAFYEVKQMGKACIDFHKAAKLGSAEAKIAITKYCQ